MLGSIFGSGNVALSIDLAHVKALEQFFQMFQLTLVINVYKLLFKVNLCIWQTNSGGKGVIQLSL